MHLVCIKRRRTCKAIFNFKKLLKERHESNISLLRNLHHRRRISAGQGVDILQRHFRWTVGYRLRVRSWFQQNYACTGVQCTGYDRGKIFAIFIERDSVALARSEERRVGKEWIS